MNYILSVLLFLNLGIFDQDIPLQITVNDLRSANGNISVSVFVDDEGFKNEKAFLHKVFSKEEYLVGKTFSCKLDLPEGRYGIVILDDENADGDMDYNWIGVPKEGYGFSNFIHKGFSKPAYSDFEFDLNKDTKEMNISLRYFN
jgi:uncharacterized protein (DUF2141 family)